MSTVGSPSGLDKTTRDLILPEKLRKEMRHPFGVLLQGEEVITTAGRCGTLISIGDVISHDLIKNGIYPKIVIYDGRTERRDAPSMAEIIERMPGRKVKVRNPPATITAQLMCAIREALMSDGNTRILVEGEEDMAALACVALAPENTCILFGMPGEGVVLVKNDRETIMKARSLMSRMEELP